MKIHYCTRSEILLQLFRDFFLVIVKYALFDYVYAVLYSLKDLCKIKNIQTFMCA